jgi:hypothetical protein
MDDKTRIPTDIDSEDPFFAWSEIKLSLRQILTVLLTFTVWFMLTRITLFVLPFSFTFAALLWSWIIIGGLFLALVKKNGLPYEEHLAHRVVYLLSNKLYIQKDPNAKYGSVEDANWEELDEDDEVYEPPSFSER